MSKENRERDVLLNLRTIEEARTGLKELAVLMGREMGTRLSQAQAFELLVANALRERGGACVK